MSEISSYSVSFSRTRESSPINTKPQGAEGIRLDPRVREDDTRGKDSDASH